MIRKFKMAGALVAVVAMFALTAPSASATFTSSLSPNSGTGTSTADVLDIFGSTVKCTENTFHVGKFNSTSSPGVHVPATFPTETLTILPTYKNCTAFGLPSTVNFTGCDLVAHHKTGLTVDLVCPEGITGVDIIVYSAANEATASCHIVVHPFTSKEGLTATNNGAHVVVTGTLANMTATQARTNIVLCPPGTHTSEVKYTVQAAGITIKGAAGSISVS